MGAPVRSFSPAFRILPRLATLHADSKSSQSDELAPSKTYNRLESALAGLSEGERYNVVLQGMLQRTKGPATASVLTSEVFPLLEEMAERRDQKLTDDSCSAILDGMASCAKCHISMYPTSLLLSFACLLVSSGSVDRRCVCDGTINSVESTSWRERLEQILMRAGTKSQLE